MKKITALKPRKVPGTSSKVLKPAKTVKGVLIERGAKGVKGEDLIIEDVSGATVDGEDLKFD